MGARIALDCIRLHLIVRLLSPGARCAVRAIYWGQSELHGALGLVRLVVRLLVVDFACAECW